MILPLPLSPELLATLRAQRDRRTMDNVERQHDAFLIDPGMGAIWLTLDGRILWEDDFEDPDSVREVTSENEVITSLVSGATKTGIAELLDLLPPRPADATTCPLCNGTRYWRPTATTNFVCWLCNGRSWATPAMIDAFGPIPPATAGR